jgi:hypothetical protein
MFSFLELLHLHSHQWMPWWEMQGGFKANWDPRHYNSKKKKHIKPGRINTNPKKKEPNVA